MDTLSRPKYGETVSIRLNRRNTLEASALNILAMVDNRREFIAHAIVAYGKNDKSLLPAANVTIDSDAFADEVARMRAEFNQQIETLSETIIAMFETMQKTGVTVNIETPNRPVEKREYATNIANAFKSRYGG